MISSPAKINYVRGIVICHSKSEIKLYHPFTAILYSVKQVLSVINRVRHPESSLRQNRTQK